MEALPQWLEKEYLFSGNESCYLTLEDGNRLHYLDIGNGMPIVMVHGHPTWSFYYRNLIKGLRSDFRCIAVDHVGCGLSDKPQAYSYTLKQHMDNLIKPVEQLGLKKFNLVVHDWGGAIGMGMAEHFVDRVERIIIMNTAAFPSSRIPPRISICRIPLLGKLLIRGLNIFVKAANYMASKKGLTKAEKMAYVFPFNSWANRIASYEFVKDIPMSVSHPSYTTLRSIEEGLVKLKEKPMMICWGGQDFCFNDHFFNEWKERFPNAEAHYFADAGHYVLEDAFEKILELSESFFASTRNNT